MIGINLMELLIIAVVVMVAVFVLAYAFMGSKRKDSD